MRNAFDLTIGRTGGIERAKISRKSQSTKRIAAANPQQSGELHCFAFSALDCATDHTPSSLLVYVKFDFERGENLQF
jgi:hypothetical protein